MGLTRSTFIVPIPPYWSLVYIIVAAYSTGSSMCTSRYVGGRVGLCINVAKCQSSPSPEAETVVNIVRSIMLMLQTNNQPGS